MGEQGRRLIAWTRVAAAVTAALVAIGGLVSVGAEASSASVVLQVTVTPSLTPAFDTAISDYIVQCAGSPTVTFAADVPAGQSLSINGGAPQTGTINTAVPLYPNQLLTWTVAGGGPSTSYFARCVPSDFPAWTASVVGTPQAQWYMFAPSAGSGGAPYVVIADAHGTPVWWMKDTTGIPSDQKLFPDGSGGWDISWATFTFAVGVVYRFFDLAGNVVRTFPTSLLLDNHDLQRTSTGTYLGIRYVGRNCPTVPADCVDESAWGGPTSVNPTDGEIVELDSSGNVIWSWSTRGHIALEESAHWITNGQRSDIIHMNSVEPDGTNGIVFSARHLDAVYHISKDTGAIDWKLGGSTTPQSLAVLGDPSGGPVLGGQHDARILADGSLTIHDNGTLLGRVPRALRFSLDLANHKATVLENVSDARVASSSCCGSARRLAGGDWVAAWGSKQLVTELTPAGDPVATITFPGNIFTYRGIPVESGVLSAATLRSGMNAMPASTTTAVSSSKSPSGFGNPVTFTATVSAQGGAGVPTGTVQFKDSASDLGAPQPLDASAHASLVTSSLAQGSHSITAVYNGDGTFPTSTSAALTQDIAPALATTMVLPSDGSTVSGSTFLDAAAQGLVAGVEFRLTGNGHADEVIGGGTNTPFGWLFTWDSTTLDDGSYTLRSRAFDDSGNSAYSPTINVTLANLTTTMLLPSSGATVSGTVLLDAAASGPVAGVDFRLTGGSYSNTLLGTASRTPYGWIYSWNTTGVAKRTYTLRSRAFDGSGNSVLSPGISITIGKPRRR